MASEKIGRTPHRCVRDDLPTFMGSRFNRYSTGDIVKCGTCGRIWLVVSGEFCTYRELRGRALRKARQAGWLEGADDDS